VQNPAHTSAHALQKLLIGLDSRLVIVKLDASVEKDAQVAVAALQQEHRI
jgi:hypothetical protein